MGTDKAEIVESRQDIRQFYCDERRICRMPEDIRQSDPRARLNCRTLAEHSTIHQPPAPHHAQRSIEKGAAHLAKTKDAAPFSIPRCAWWGGGARIVRCSSNIRQFSLVGGSDCRMSSTHSTISLFVAITLSDILHAFDNFYLIATQGDTGNKKRWSIQGINPGCSTFF